MRDPCGFNSSELNSSQGWTSWALVHSSLSTQSVGGVNIIFHSKGLYPLLCHSNISGIFPALNLGAPSLEQSSVSSLHLS